MEPVIERPALPFDLRGLVQALIAICQQYGQRINRLLLGPHYPITDAERDAGVTPVDLRYPPGDVKRYGATANDSSDDTQAIQTAINSGDVTITFPPGTYNISAS